MQGWHPHLPSQQEGGAARRAVKRGSHLLEAPLPCIMTQLGHSCFFSAVNVDYHSPFHHQFSVAPHQLLLSLISSSIISLLLNTELFSCFLVASLFIVRYFAITHKYDN